jgi:hypothetical protein
MLLKAKENATIAEWSARAPAVHAVVRSSCKFEKHSLHYSISLQVTRNTTKSQDSQLPSQGSNPEASTKHKR